MDCAAIVGTKGRPRELAACLASLAAMRPALREVIVVDQGDGPPPPALPDGPPVTVLRREAKGLSHARNQGLVVARAEWIFFPDDDCTVAPDALERAAVALKRLPEAAFLSSRVVGLARAADGDEPRVLSSPGDVLRLSLSAGLFVRRDTLERLHGFDERFGVGSRYPSGEESELLFRALREGAWGLYAPAIRIFHPDPFTRLDARGQEQRAFEYGRGWGAMLSKHAMWPDGRVYVGLHRRYLMRALGGAALAGLTLRPALARRYWASFRGRMRGWDEWYRRERFGP